MTTYPKWIEIPGFPGYEASKEEGVRKVWKDGMGHWNDLKLTVAGDGKVSLRLSGKIVRVLVASLVALAHPDVKLLEDSK